MVELLGLPFSPWSEKACWALDARRVPYRYRTYAPLVGEPALRLKLRKWTGLVTVPVLTDDDGRAIGDSADIARWADGRGEGPLMFPPGREAEVLRFVDLSERGLSAGRALSLRRMMKDDEALAEISPRPLRKAFGRWSSRVGSFGVGRTLRKYGVGETGGGYAETITEVLEELRAALARAAGGSTTKTLLGTFSFADVAMTQVLVCVEPPTFGLRMGIASRRSFRDDVLKERFGDLLAWRDAIYEAHRPRAGSGSSSAALQAPVRES